jgi:hypothetical protein
VICIISIVISKNDKILIVAPHSDDECIGAGGILCGYSDKCSVVVLTDGCQGQGGLLTSDYRQQRQEEFIGEMRYLDHSAAYHCVINALKKQKNCKTEIYLYEVHRIRYLLRTILYTDYRKRRISICLTRKLFL